MTRIRRQAQNRRPMASTLLATLLLALPSAHAVSLSDFRPETTGLSSTCDTVYRSPIADCTTTDFKTGGGCSQNCLQGLVTINSQIAAACGSDNPGSDTLVGIFKAGKGIRALCNVEVVTKSSEAGSAPTSTDTVNTGPAPATTTDATTSTSPAGTRTTTTSSATKPRTSQSSGTSSSQTTSRDTLPLPSMSSSGPQSTLTVSSTPPPQQPTAVPNTLPRCGGKGGSPFDGAPGQTCQVSGASPARELLGSAAAAVVGAVFIARGLAL